MKSVLRKLRDRMLGDVARKRDLEQLYAHINGLFQIQNAMSGHPIVHALRGWAISPDAMAYVLAGVERSHEPKVIEFGAGLSTAILASTLKHRGGKLVSVEHDPAFLASVQRQIAACGLSDVVEFVLAGLVDVDVESGVRSYDTAALPDLEVDVALIDGPPATTGPFARYIPLLWTADHLRIDGIGFLDDASREEEKECIAKLMRNRPGIVATQLVAEKGLVKIQRVPV